MIHLALRTEFSFKNCFLHMKDIHKYAEHGYVGIADDHSTFGHIPLQQEADKHGFKPIFGVRINTLPDESKQRTASYPWIYIAKNNNGLRELYMLLEKAYDQFHYVPRINYSDVDIISNDIIIIMPYKYSNDSRLFIAKGPGYDYRYGNVYIDNNNYGNIDDKKVYQLMAGTRKHGEGYIHKFNEAIYDQHILSNLEARDQFGEKACFNTIEIAESCTARIPTAKMVKWKGSSNITSKCLKNIDKVSNWTDEYDERLLYELNLIKEKDYVDYFLIVADLINEAKKNMLVGPARGSSAGSLVCYLLGITEVDPIEHNLIFERFIDVNRFDLPDIDIDFPDHKREKVVAYLKKKYGKDKVKCLANINRFKAKSAIGEFAKSLGIPAYETTEVKDAIIERSSGDARAAMCIEDTFTTTDPGKRFIEKYPVMNLVSHIEDHATHAGKHAAGIIVSTEQLCTYGTLNNRDDIIMMDKKMAEDIGLLKIDCLGLRTLSILEGVAEQIGEDLLFFYNLPLDDKKTFKLFNDMRLSGIFQFEGQALQLIVKQMGVNNFNDIAAITALARPGALNSGGTARYIKYSTGEETPSYYSDTHMAITSDTYGIVVYQEQMMEIARKIGKLSWADTSTLRRAASKSMGDEFFGKFKHKFMLGALEDYSQEDAEQMWVDISASGSWSFNKSHAVSYGLVSYWTAYCKANYPMEFAVACLNHAANPDNARKLLRDLIKYDNLEYVPVDPDISEIGWSYQGNKLIGGLTNIKGIAETKAKKIIRARNKEENLTPAIYKLLMNPKTEFDILFPTEHYWGKLYSNPAYYGMEYKPVRISEIDGIGEYVFIGKLIDRNTRDLNEHVFLSKRNGEIIEEDNLYLNFKLEDDEDSISCKIGRYQFERMGRKIAESGKVGESWYLARGKIKSDWRKVDIIEIINLNEYFPKGI